MIATSSSKEGQDDDVLGMYRDSTMILVRVGGGAWGVDCGDDKRKVGEIVFEKNSRLQLKLTLSHPPGFTPEEGLNEGNTVNLDMKDYGENERDDNSFVNLDDGKDNSESVNKNSESERSGHSKYSSSSREQELRKVDGFDKLVRDSWNVAPVNKKNVIRNFMGKLKFSKETVYGPGSQSNVRNSEVKDEGLGFKAVVRSSRVHILSISKPAGIDSFTVRALQEIMRKISSWWNIDYSDVNSYCTRNGKFGLFYSDFNPISKACFEVYTMVLWWMFIARSSGTIVLKNP
ncbi:hypothetical protein Tco_0942287 [Tanacetum coccineum]